MILSAILHRLLSKIIDVINFSYEVAKVFCPAQIVNYREVQSFDCQTLDSGCATFKLNYICLENNVIYEKRGSCIIYSVS